MQNPSERISGPFGAIPMWAVEAGVSPRGCLLLAWLAGKYANKSHQAWPTKDTLAENMKVDVATIYRVLKELEDLGAIKVEKRFRFHGKYKYNFYTIIYEPPLRFRDDPIEDADAVFGTDDDDDDEGRPALRVIKEQKAKYNTHG